MDRWRLEGMLAGAPRPVELDIIRFASDGILMLPVRSSFLPTGTLGKGLVDALAQGPCGWRPGTGAIWA